MPTVEQSIDVNVDVTTATYFALIMSTSSWWLQESGEQYMEVQRGEHDEQRTGLHLRRKVLR